MSELGLTETLGPKFTLDRLDWPEDDDDDGDEDGEGEKGVDHDSEDGGNALTVDLEDERLQRIDERDLAKGKKSRATALYLVQITAETLIGSKTKTTKSSWRSSRCCETTSERFAKEPASMKELRATRLSS